MNNPTHPGLIIRDDVLPELQLTVDGAAEQMGVPFVTLSRVINGHSAITAEMALRVGKWVGNGPEIWLRMQGQYDLWQAKKKGDVKVAQPASVQSVNADASFRCIHAVNCRPTPPKALMNVFLFLNPETQKPRNPETQKPRNRSHLLDRVRRQKRIPPGAVGAMSGVHVQCGEACTQIEVFSNFSILPGTCPRASIRLKVSYTSVLAPALRNVFSSLNHT